MVGSSDLIYGIVFIIAHVFCYRWAYVFYKKEQYSLSLCCIILGGFMLRLWCITDPFLHDWDESYHALVAKNLIDNPLKPTLFIDPILNYDYRQWTLNHVWLHKQQLSLWLISLSIQAFGNHEWAVRLPSLIVSTLSIGLTFRIALHFLESTPKALLVAFFQAINGYVIDIASGRSSTDHVDTVFFFWIELAILCIVLHRERQKHLFIIGAGVALGLSFLTKSFPALIVVLIYGVLNMCDKSYKALIFNALVMIVIASCLYLPWQFYIFKTFPQEAHYENQYNFEHLFTALEGQTGAWWFYMDYARRVWNELIYGVFIWFLIYLFHHKNNLKLWALWVWIVVPYAFFSMVATKMWGYVLFTVPAIFIIEAHCMWHIKYYYIKFTVLRHILIYAIIILTIRYAYERVTPFPTENYYKQCKNAQSIKDLSKTLSKTEKNVIFGVENYVACMFYHEGTIAYPFVPKQAVLDSLRKEKYHIIVVNANNE
jgi:4-amino-4-deoxy-L-arabinose transferase-like glycosyltransferase